MPVLVVDDNGTNRRILVEMLSTWGMKPESVDGGSAALAALQRASDENRPFRLVIADMQMPQMDGCTLAKKIRKSLSFGTVPVLMLSSGGQSDEAPRCRKLAISAYLMKPAQPSDLLDAILMAFSRPMLIESALETAAKTNAPAVEMDRLRILLAEDNPVNQKLAITLLQKRGHTVIPTGNGKEAIDALERENVDRLDGRADARDGRL